MKSDKSKLQFGIFLLELPHCAEITAEVIKPPQPDFGLGYTYWTVDLRRFRLRIGLSTHRLSTLKEFIDGQTKGNVEVEPMTVNGLAGVSYGDYSPPRTWRDIWFRKDGLTITLNLQSTIFPFTEPTKEEIEEHERIIHSIALS